jgi:hypothetical protein
MKPSATDDIVAQLLSKKLSHENIIQVYGCRKRDEMMQAALYRLWCTVRYTDSKVETDEEWGLFEKLT